MIKIKLDKILEAIEFQTDESLAVINKKTAEVYMITEEVIMYAEGDSAFDCPEWMTELDSSKQKVIMKMKMIL